MFVKHYAPTSNKVPKSYFQHNGQILGHKVIDLGVIWKGINTQTPFSRYLWKFVYTSVMHWYFNGMSIIKVAIMFLQQFRWRSNKKNGVWHACIREFSNI